MLLNKTAGFKLLVVILSVDVVVRQFYPWFKFYSALFVAIVTYENELETKEGYM